MTVNILPNNSINRKIVIEKLQNGEIVAIVTETVYGLAADATNHKAVAKIYHYKKRPAINPLIIHFANFTAAQHYVIFNKDAQKITQQYSSGPITLVLPAKLNNNISKLATAGLATLAIRVPQNLISQQILQRLHFPLAAPSANLSTTISTTSAQVVQKSFVNLKQNLTILDGGNTTIGLESTILDLSTNNPCILRPGIITKEAIAQVLDKDIGEYQGHAIKVPGQMAKHYAPSIPLRINITTPLTSEALLTFGSQKFNHQGISLNLSNNGSLTEAAANLFAYLHKFDDPIYTGIAVVPIPNIGIGIAINDRLNRAAYTAYD